MGSPWNLFLVTTVCLISNILSSLPGVFDDYFNEDVRIVDVSQKEALKACLNVPGPLIIDINEANRRCLGDDSSFDWNDFAEMNTGPDANSNGISNSMEMKEMCFYREIGWLDGDKMQKANIFGHFDTFKNSDLQSAFRDNVNECINWSADLGGSRKKRSIEEEQLGEEIAGVFSMVNHIRQKRQAKSVKKSPKKVVKKAKSKKKGPQVKSARKSIKKRKSPKKKTIKKKGKRKSAKKTGIGARQNINSEAYNKCWCVDLAVQKALKKCVEDLLKQK